MTIFSFPEMYERWLVAPLFRPWADDILDDVALTSSDRLLDVACGAGIVARVAAERLGDPARVVGVDVNPRMLAVARATSPAIDWREGDAAALPLQRGETFDVVVCQQGLQFFPDNAVSVREMRRALAPGGRAAVATWRSTEEAPFIVELQAVAERHVGPINDRRHSLGDAAALDALLREAGLEDVRVTTISKEVRFSEGSAFLRLNTMAVVGMSARAKELTDEERERAVDAIVAESADVLARYSEGGTLALDIATNLATGAAAGWVTGRRKQARGRWGAGEGVPPSRVAASPTDASVRSWAAVPFVHRSRKGRVPTSAAPVQSPASLFAYTDMGTDVTVGAEPNRRTDHEPHPLHPSLPFIRRRNCRVPGHIRRVRRTDR